MREPQYDPRTIRTNLQRGNERVGEFRARASRLRAARDLANVARQMLAFRIYFGDSGTNLLGNLGLANVVEHHGRRKNLRRGVADILARDVGRTTMNLSLIHISLWRAP